MELHSESCASFAHRAVAADVIKRASGRRAVIIPRALALIPRAAVSSLEMVLNNVRFEC